MVGFSFGGLLAATLQERQVKPKAAGTAVGWVLLFMERGLQYCLVSVGTCRDFRAPSVSWGLIV